MDRISIIRLQEFLSLPEMKIDRLTPNSMEKKPSNGDTIVSIENAEFQWLNFSFFSFFFEINFFFFFSKGIFLPSHNM